MDILRKFQKKTPISISPGGFKRAVSAPPAAWTPLLRPRKPPHGRGAALAAPEGPGNPPPAGDHRWVDELMDGEWYTGILSLFPWDYIHHISMARGVPVIVN